MIQYSTLHQSQSSKITGLCTVQGTALRAKFVAFWLMTDVVFKQCIHNFRFHGDGVV